MGDSYVTPVPSVEDVREGDILELDDDLYVAREDGCCVGGTKPFSENGEEYAVKLRGPTDRDRLCHLAEVPGRDAADRDLFLYRSWDLGYKERAPIDEFCRCFRTGLTVRPESDDTG